MSNVEGPQQGSRVLLATVLYSVLLYGSPQWAAHAHNGAVMKIMAPVQRRIALKQRAQLQQRIRTFLEPEALHATSDT